MALLTVLALIWAGCTVVLIALMIYRGVVGMHEEDQIFLSDAAHRFEQDRDEVVHRLQRLSPYIRAATAASAIMAVAVAGVWLLQSFRSF